MIRNKIIREGLIGDKSNTDVRPDLKYYAFDWDDNLMFMPTEIMVSDDDNEVGMSTEDFAEYRLKIGVEEFEYKGKKIVSFAEDPFRNFKTQGNKKFIIDSMTAEIGPAWSDFVECINGGSIFSIITARGHNPEVLKEGVLNLILSNKHGLSQNTLLGNLKRYEQLSLAGGNSKNPIEDYLSLCKFHPVSFGEGSATSPEEGKNKAIKEFVFYCREQAKTLIQNILEKDPSVSLDDLKPVFKDDVSMAEPLEDLEEFVRKFVKIGFSDDDERNVSKMDQFLSSEFDEKPVDIFLTKGGKKEKYN